MSNNATHALYLLLSNDEGFYRESINVARSHEPEDIDDIAEHFEDWVTTYLDPSRYVEEINPDATLSEWADTYWPWLQDIGRLSDVEWLAIAALFAEDAKGEDL